MVVEESRLIDRREDDSPSTLVEMKCKQTASLEVPVHPVVEQLLNERLLIILQPR